MAQLSFKPGNKAMTINTCGELPAVGTQAPEFTLVNGRLEDVTLATYAGKLKILNIIPSLDTPVCAASARAFNEKVSKFENAVVLMVSADLPFAQGRFCESEGLKNIIALSTFRASFAEDYGVLMTDSLFAGLTARAVVVINTENDIIYTQLVTEITHEPDYDAVIDAVNA